MIGYFPGYRGFAAASVLTYQLPSRRTEYLTTDDALQWEGRFSQLDANGEYELDEVSNLTSYRAGQLSTDRWNHAVFGPSFPESLADGDLVTRLGDQLAVSLALYSDGANHVGFSVVDSGRTKLYRNGVKIAENDEPGFGGFEVPAAPANYLLEVNAVRTGVSGLSTRVSAAWTFRSGHVSGDTPQSLPLSAVRFTPRLDDADGAPGGPVSQFFVPIMVQRQQGASPSAVRALTVEVSYDDGQNWRRAALFGFGPYEKGWFAILNHPAGPGFVSLRATATHEDGATVRQAIIRAYRLNATHNLSPGSQKPSPQASYHLFRFRTVSSAARPAGFLPAHR